MNGLRHACSSWWGRLGILGGLLMMAVIFTLGPWMLLVPEASTCQVPYTFVHNQVPTAAEWNLNPSYMCTLWNNGISDENVAAGANIDQDKLESLLNNTTFTDHDARHEPGGADEINDIDIGNTGTNLTLHGARHSGSGPDPIPELQGVLGTRHPYVAEAGLQANVTRINLLVGPYKSGAVANQIPRDITYCGGFVYVLVDDVSGGDADFVLKITGSTMALQSSITLTGLLGAADTPKRIVCAADDKTYVLVDGGAVDTNVLLTISTAGTVSTLTAFAGLSIDGVVTMVADPNTTALYLVGQDNTIANDRLLIRVTTGGTVTTTLDGGDANDDFKDLFFFTRDGVDLIGLMRRDTVANECHMRVYNTAAPPVLQTIYGANSWVLQSGAGGYCTGIEFDGAFVAFDSETANNAVQYFDMGAMALAPTHVVPNLSATLDWLPQNTFFDGRRMYLQGTSAYTFILPPMLGFGENTVNQSFNFSGGLTGTVRPCGMASDGTSLYVCSRDSAANDEFFVTKNLALIGG